MKIFITTFFLVISISCWSQLELGYTEYAIKNDFSDKYFQLGYTDDNIKYMYWQDDDMVCGYYFNEQGICYSNKVIPKRQGIINMLAEKYNKQYTIISDTHWKWYSDNGIVDIELIYPSDESKPYFNAVKVK